MSKKVKRDWNERNYDAERVQNPELRKIMQKLGCTRQWGYEILRRRKAGESISRPMGRPKGSFGKVKP